MELSKHIRRASIFRWPLFAAICMIPLLGGCSGSSFSLGTITEQLILGLILGSVYALIALGYTLVYGVIKLINFAHGDIYMLGAFIGYYMLRLTIRHLNFTYGWSLIWCFVISVVVSAALCAAVAVLMERLAYRPLRGSSRIAALITAVGVSFLLENAGIIVFGPNPKSFEPKTLGVYQIQLADNPEFNDAKLLEVTDSAQKEFPRSRFLEVTYARVRLVNKDGTSAWGPSIKIDPSQPNGYVELSEDELANYEGAAGPPAVLPSISYNPVGDIDQVLVQKMVDAGELVVKEGKVLTPDGQVPRLPRKQVELTWATGQAGDIQVNSVFANSDNKQLAFTLPVKSSDGELVRVPVFYVVIIVVTILLLWLLNVLINKSTFGMSMRALSFDMQAAKLMGINTDKIIAQTFAIGGACAAVAGNMVGIYNQSIEPLMGILPGIKAFVAAVVGGIGSIPGAAAGGMIMGLSEALVKGWIDPAWSAMADAVAFAILILVLLFKPSGIFGLSVKEKV